MSGLDYGNQLRLLDLIRRLAAAGYAFLQSTHFPEHALLVSDRVLLLHHGRILAEGRPAQVVTADHIDRLYGVQVEVIAIAGGYLCCVPKLAANPIARGGGRLLDGRKTSPPAR
ncbi:hypothetical protein [Candidatus Methylocalor cossyra]|uniref:hypothetical protein n=1 Tax=Candidatus Methylocalor cossyra TaxID=3108543 RepID=UPI0032B12562